MEAGRNSDIHTIEVIFEATNGLQIPSLNGSSPVAIISISSDSLHPPSHITGINLKFQL